MYEVPGIYGFAQLKKIFVHRLPQGPFTMEDVGDF
jgi:hypothetical protein